MRKKATGPIGVRFLWGWLWAASLGCSQAAPQLLPPLPPVEQARQLTRSGRAEQAFRALRAPLADHPRDLAVHRAWVEAAARAGHLEEVEAHYRELVERPATAAIGHYGLGLLAVAHGGSSAPEALEQLKLAQRAWPREADIPYRIGLLFLQDQKPDRAREAFEAALALDGTRASFLVAHAHALTLCAQEDAARKELRSLWGRDPSEEDAQKAAQIEDKLFSPLRGVPEPFADDLRSALLSLQRDAVQPALDAMERVIAQRPDLAMAHTVKGLAHSRLDNRAEAIAALEQSLELSPANPLALVALGDLYMRVGKQSEARAEYQKALELHPFHRDATARMASLARQGQDHEKAALYYGRLLKLTPADAEVRQSYSRSLVATGSWQLAFPVVEGGLLRNPQDFHGWLELGKLYLLRASRVPDERALSRSRARACFEKAQALDRENPAVATLIKQLED